VKTLFEHAWSEAEHDLGYKPGEEPLTPGQAGSLFRAGVGSGSNVRRPVQRTHGRCGPPTPTPDASQPSDRLAMSQQEGCREWPSSRGGVPAAASATASRELNANRRGRISSKSADLSMNGNGATSFGTRGSQVQILPLRPRFLKLRSLTRPVMRNETRPVITAEPLCRKISHRRSRRSAYHAGACLGGGAP
jgi:hypothetical protein